MAKHGKIFIISYHYYHGNLYKYPISHENVEITPYCTCHWENSLHFLYAPWCVSFFYAPNCINASPKIIHKCIHAAAFYFSCTHAHWVSLRVIIKGSIITQTLQTKSRNFKSSFVLWYFDYCSVLQISEN